MSLQVVAYNQQEHEALWEAFIEKCPMATWMHTRRFLSYHGDRFQDCSVLIQNAKGQLLGILPAALDPGNATRIVNHAGLSYGGLLHDGSLKGQAMIDAFLTIASHYQSQGYQTLRYKAVPDFYHAYPCQDDLYALFRLNASRYRCDLSSIIDVENRPPLDQKRRWESQQAAKKGIEIVLIESEADITALWDVLQENLSRKHGAKPVHSLNDILLLKTLFPEDIKFITAQDQGTIIAGFVLFISKMVVHLQYSASSQAGYDCFALHPIVEKCVEITKESGRRYFDFGISNEKDGQYLNTGLHAFKSKFGAGGAIHEFYDLDFETALRAANQ